MEFGEEFTKYDDMKDNKSKLRAVLLILYGRYCMRLRKYSEQNDENISGLEKFVNQLFTMYHNVGYGERELVRSMKRYAKDYSSKKEIEEISAIEKLYKRWVKDLIPRN